MINKGYFMELLLGGFYNLGFLKIQPTHVFLKKMNVIQFSNWL